MADRATIRTGFPQEEFPGGRFTRAPDPRFGGNMARANEGAQYVGSPRDYYGGPSKGSPMHDARYGNYVAPHRVDYTRNAPPQSSGTPNFRGPDRGSGAYLANQFGRGDDGGGLGGLQEQAAIPNWYKWYDKLINRFGKERGSELWHQYASDDTGIGSTNEYQMAELSNKQGNFMESGLGNPNWYSNFPDYFDTVTGKGDWKQKLGWKDEATEQEVIDKLNQMMQERNQSLPWPVV